MKSYTEKLAKNNLLKSVQQANTVWINLNLQAFKGKESQEYLSISKFIKPKTNGSYTKTGIPMIPEVAEEIAKSILKELKGEGEWVVSKDVKEGI